MTDYYAKKHTYQSGLQSEEWLLGELAGQIATLQRSQNRSKVTLADSSRRAWENGGFGVGDLSYYNKGLVVGFLIDAAIRSETDGKKEPRRCDAPPLHPAFIAQGRATPRMASSGRSKKWSVEAAVGGEFRQRYDKWVNSTEEPGYGTLNGLGLRLLSPNEAFIQPRFKLEGDAVVDSMRRQRPPACAKEIA